MHATCVAASGGHAVLLRGAPGTGKSDLALRLIDHGWVLVSDDYTALEADGGKLVAHAPAPIKGLMEVRQIGVLKAAATIDSAPVIALFELVQRGDTERLPDPETEEILGISVPKFTICAFDASASAKVRLTVDALTHGRFLSEAAKP